MTEPVAEPIRVVQLSDTHFLEAGAEPEGMGAYDTGAAFDAVFAAIEQSGTSAIDHVVVTGDVADHGRAEQYEVAAAALSRFPVDVNVCPGNHDFEVPFRDHLVGANISRPRLVERGAWAFLFVDSVSGMMVADGDTLVDPPDSQRLHSNGALSDAEKTAVRDACASTAAEHVFVWLHHPPGADDNYMADAAYNADWRALLDELPKVRGIGGGHLHVAIDWELRGRTVFLAPSLKNNFSLEENTWKPPGWRSFAFHPDGSIDSEVHYVDHDDRWPARPMGRALQSLFRGELSFAELAEIVARRQARDAAAAE